MNNEGGTTLYLQVEQALQDFQKGVAKLKAQQVETEALLTKSNEALDNLVLQAASAEKIQAEMQADFRLLEKFRLAQTEENAQFYSQVKAELRRQNLRRQELLGQIEDLGKDLRGQLQTLNTEVNGFKKQAAALKGLEAKIQLLETYANRQRILERKQRYLVWAFAALLALVLASLVL